MERLTLLDQLMHKVTTTGLPPLNMQGASVLDPAKSSYKIDAKTLVGHVATRLDGVPILRKKLIQDPLRLGDLRLVDDARFDVRNHITYSKVPPPGDLHALERHLGCFSAEPLDSERPLWRVEVIDGLRDGRLAIAQKLSHATMDGMAAMRVMQCLYDDAPQRPRSHRSRIWQPEHEPTSMQLLGSALRENAERFVVHSPRVAWKLLSLGARSVVTAVEQGLGRAGDTAKGQLGTAPEARATSLNTTISTDLRNVSFATFEVDKLKALCRSLDCTLNDLCLLLVSEALQAYFRGIGEALDFDLVTVMPLDMRQTAKREMGNAIAVGRISLHNTIAVLPERLRAIRADTTELKEANRGGSAAEKSVLGEIATVIPPISLDLLGYLLKATQPWDRLPLMMNTLFSNVPGPRRELYLAGMPIDLQIPIIPMFHTGALAIGGTSIGNHFCFGFHTCGRVVRREDMHFFVDGVEGAYRQLTRRSVPTGRPRRRADSREQA